MDNLDDLEPVAAPTEPAELAESAEPDAPPEPRPKAPPIHSRFLFVDVAAMRAKQLRRGSLPRLDDDPHSSEAHRPDPHKPERVAMEEVRRGLVLYDVVPGHCQVTGRHPKLMPNMLCSSSDEIAIPWRGFDRVFVNLTMPARQLWGMEATVRRLASTIQAFHGHQET